MSKVRAIIHYSEKNPTSGPYKRIKLHGKDAHVNLAWDFSQIESRVGNLSEEAKDLLDIATGTYLVDLITSRSKSFYHEFVLTVQVRNLSLWEDLRDDLNFISSYLMRSPVEYRFLEGPRAKGEPRTSTSLPSIKSVACLSGGVDSCLGAAILAREGNTLLMSQYTCPSILSLQKRIVSNIPWENSPIHLPIFVRRKEHLGATRSYLQPSRSLLYLALTGSIATAIGSTNIFMFENGPMSIGIPYTSARFHTRTVHPVVLDRIQHVIRGIPGGGTVRVHNPFGGMTKGDEILEYHKLVPTDVLHGTCSCSMRDRVKAHRGRLGKDDY